MYSCIQCGKQMYQSINALCHECQESYTSGLQATTERPQVAAKIHKGYLIRLIKEMIKSRPTGVYSHGDSKGYNRAIHDIMQMIDRKFA